MRSIEHFIGGQTVVGTSGRHSDVFDPNSGQVQARVPLASADELDRAVASAVVAQKDWAQVNPQRRAIQSWAGSLRKIHWRCGPAITLR
jgi:malonate-semialdehyde dehydrogenase (acetylating)/methylmalonate-semialdehyde dehydrogenase